MKLPLSWLSDYTDISGVTPKEYDARMTMSGSKVEEVCYLGEEIENVVVGRINEMVRHPNSDHMWICQIDVGDEVTQICTGAWNIHVGDLIPVAKHKSTLPGGIKITKGKLRGEVSNGMLCSLKELQLDVHNAPYAVIKPAAILNDYACLKDQKPSLPEDLTAGYKIYGKTLCAKVLSVKTTGYSQYDLTVDFGAGETALSTDCSRTSTRATSSPWTRRRMTVCTPDDLHAPARGVPRTASRTASSMLERGLQAGRRHPQGAWAWTSGWRTFEITSNRPDCLSVIGLARETAATFDRPFHVGRPGRSRAWATTLASICRSRCKRS